MPISSFLGLETSLRGLLAQQMALNVTSNNIANADQAGYTRQQVNMAQAPTLNLPGSSRTAAGSTSAREPTSSRSSACATSSPTSSSAPRSSASASRT
jgi:flagellar hook protein FlgE